MESSSSLCIQMLCISERLISIFVSFSSADAVDGLLAAVTDLLTHVLTIGKAIISFGLQPQNRSLLIHILNGFNKVDLIGSDHSSSNLPSRFHELLNMFPDNKVSEVQIEKEKGEHLSAY